MTPPTREGPPRHIFVGGLHRSGTSLLTAVLAAHPDVSALRDTGVYEDEGQHLQDVFETAARLGGPGRFATHSHLGPLGPIEARYSRRRLLRSWEPFWDLQLKVLVEKSPPNLVRTQYLQSIFPSAAFVMIVRHPIVVAMATRKWCPDPIGQLVEHWVQAHRILLADAVHVRRLRLVRYEDLVMQPEATARSLFAFANLAPTKISVAVDPGHNARYLEARLDTPKIHTAEHDANVFGYSLLDPGVTVPPDPLVAQLLATPVGEAAAPA